METLNLNLVKDIRESFSEEVTFKMRLETTGQSGERVKQAGDACVKALKLIHTKNRKECSWPSES